MGAGIDCTQTDEEEDELRTQINRSFDRHRRALRIRTIALMAGFFSLALLFGAWYDGYL